MRIFNVHERLWDTGADRVGALLDGLGGDDDRLWPHERWPPLKLDRALELGSRGGHGPVRYRVTEYVRGRKVVFEFDRKAGLMHDVRGTHAFEVVESAGRYGLRHVIAGECGLRAALRWWLVVRPLHDALLEDALDGAARVVTGKAPPPRPWSLRVRLLRRLARRGSRTR